MRPLWKDFLTALWMGLVLPGIILNTADMLLRNQQDLQKQETIPETVAQEQCQPMRLRLTGAGTEEMDMDLYLTRVLLAEVPADFETEMLKAQSVAARTYAQKAWEIGGKHGDGSVCTKSVCCQGYITEEDYLNQGGTQEGIEKIRNAVTSTSGQVLTYEGELIEATYFSCSGGMTEDAQAVWGSSFPYLQSVESPGEENAVYYTDTVVYTLQQFQNLLGIFLPEETEAWFGEVTRTEGGGVATIEIAGAIFTGTQLRSLLGLRSTNFTISAGEQITITTKGYGHRVGLSQYGAEAMAVNGSTYEEILSHYYPGTLLTNKIEG